MTRVPASTIMDTGSLFNCAEPSTSTTIDAEMIRRLEPHELDLLLELYRHLHHADDPLPAPQVIAHVWAEIMSSTRYRYLGAFADGRLVASCTLTIIPNLTRGCRPYGVIENVVTHADHRRRGHGRAILNEALRQAWADDCYKVMLLTDRKDEATMQFYESAGFDPNAKQAFLARP